MRLPFVAFSAIVLFAVTGVTVAVRAQAVAWKQSGGPPVLPARWLDPRAERTVWVFLRPGCRHCADHVQALESALAAYPASTQTRLRSQLVFVTAGAAPAGARLVADSLRAGFGVRIAPTTWWVEGDGAVRRAWRGARLAGAWTQALEFLAARAAAPGVP